jgi:hypothetical protein
MSFRYLQKGYVTYIMFVIYNILPYVQHTWQKHETLTTQGRRPLGRPTYRWEDTIKMNLREIGYED